MLTIRLSRVGKPKQPQYRIVVQEKIHDPWSPAIEVIGHFNPRARGEQLQLDDERVKHWISVGAQPSETIHNMLIDRGLIKGDKVRKMSLTKKRRDAMAEAKKASEKATVTDAPAT